MKKNRDLLLKTTGRFGQMTDWRDGDHLVGFHCFSSTFSLRAHAVYSLSSVSSHSNSGKKKKEQRKEGEQRKEEELL